MRKCILALVALLGWITTSHAAYWQGQTYAGPPQIFYNILSPPAGVTPAATCNGDKQVFTTTVTTTSGTKDVNTSTSIFAPGDVGKTITVPGLNQTGGVQGYGIITTYISPTQVQIQNTILVNLNASLTVGLGSDDAPALKAFNVWAQANQGSNQVVLTIPNGANCWIATNQIITQPIAAITNYGNYFFSGINNLIVEGTGATIDSVNGARVNWGALAQLEQGLTVSGGLSARLKTALAGATTVELTAASYATGNTCPGVGYICRFTVGAPVMISGMDIQSGYNQNYGVPSNHQFFNYAIITSICINTAGCPGTATITFDKPLTWTVLDTWPEYFAGGTNQLDQGGPATIYALHPFWKASVEYRGLTITDNDDQTYAKIQNVTFRNVTVNSKGGIVPSGNETFTIRNSVQNINASPGWEVDKLVTTLDIDGWTGAAGGIMRRIDFQSSSVDLLIMKNANIGSTFGTPKSSLISDTHFDLFRPGAWTNGVSTGSQVCIRCDVTTFSFLGGVFQNSPSLYSKSSGVISTLNSNEVAGNGPPHRIFVPGGNVYYSSTGYTTIGILQSTGITQDPTNVFTATNSPDGFPALSGVPAFNVHPAWQWTCDTPNPASDPTFIASCVQAGAAPLAPLGSYGRRSYTATALFNATTNAQPIRVRGKLTSLTINVTQAYTGTGSQTLNPTAQFANGMVTIDQSTWTEFRLFPSINTKQPGIRVITPGGVTCDTGGGPVAGGCSGDTISEPSGSPITGGYPPNAVWIQDVIQPSIFGTFASTGGGVDSQFTITIQTDQSP